jgi:hypothetical protein
MDHEVGHITGKIARPAHLKPKNFGINDALMEQRHSVTGNRRPTILRQSAGELARLAPVLCTTVIDEQGIRLLPEFFLQEI